MKKWAALVAALGIITVSVAAAQGRDPKTVTSTTKDIQHENWHGYSWYVIILNGGYSSWSWSPNAVSSPEECAKIVRYLKDHTDVRDAACVPGMQTH